MEKKPNEKTSKELYNFLEGKDTHRIFIPAYSRFEIHWAVGDESTELENKIVDTGPCTIAVIVD
jgi:hypothetical protein